MLPFFGSRREAVCLGGLILAFLALTLAYNVVVPPWEALDESEHVQYVHFVARNWRLPARLPTLQLTGNDESFQTPLYYLIAAAATSRVQPTDLNEIRLNPYVSWENHSARLAIAAHSPVSEGWPPSSAVAVTHVARLISTIFGVATVLFTYLLARAVTKRTCLALSAAAAVAFLPGFVFSSATVSNDAALIALASAAALLTIGVRATRTNTARLALIATVLLLAVATKLSGVVVAAAAGLALVITGLPALKVAGVIAPSLLAAVVWAWVGGWGPTLLGRQDWPPHQTFSLDYTLGGLAAFARTIIGVFGWQNVPLPDALYGVMAALGLPPLLALARIADRRLLVALVAWPILLGVAMLARWWPFEDPEGYLLHGRFFYPALAPGATLLALAWASIPWKAVRLVAWLPPLGLLATTVLAVPLAIEPSYRYREDIAGFVAPTFAPAVPLHNFAPGLHLHLIGFEMAPACPKRGDTVRLSLFWKGGETLEAVDTVVVMESDSWPRTGLSQLDPGRSLYPSSVWLPTDEVRDDHEFWLASDLPNGTYTLRVGTVPWQTPGGLPRVWGRVDIERARTAALVHLGWASGRPSDCQLDSGAGRDGAEGRD